MRIEIGRVVRTSDTFPGISRELFLFTSIKTVRSTLKSVNMAAVGIFIGANIIFIIGFAILFVCQKRILTKVSIPNIDPGSSRPISYEPYRTKIPGKKNHQDNI